MQHIIKKQFINLTLNEKAGAFRIQQTVSGHYRQDIVPLMENIFNELSKEEETIHIDKLEIDLGILSEKEVNQAHWGETILLKRREQLIKQIEKQLDEKTINKEAESFTVCRQWLFYMQRGHLPWNVIDVNDTWYDKVLETLAVDFTRVTELRGIIMYNPVVSRRIVLQQEEAFLVKLIEILTAENQYELPGLIQQLSKLHLLINKKALTKTSKHEAIKEIWKQVVKIAATSGKKLTPQQLAEIFLGQEKTYLTVLENVIVNHADELALILPVIRKVLENKIEQSTDAGGFSAKKDDKTSEGLTEIEEGVFIQNAGMVLIHPFLPALFKRLQWVKEGKFENEGVQQKALYLLHFIATGNIAAKEFELAVPKILCKWPIGTPVEKDIELSNDEVSEAGNMLQAAIEQWEVLKNTSPDGLREGFLQRRGKYFSKNDKWYLQVESGSLDVLLDKLPWNLNMIKLPWMKEILWVEWR